MYTNDSGFLNCATDEFPSVNPATPVPAIIDILLLLLTTDIRLLLESATYILSDIVSTAIPDGLLNTLLLPIGVNSPYLLYIDIRLFLLSAIYIVPL